jgi:hypothetical protein
LGHLRLKTCEKVIQGSVEPGMLLEVELDSFEKLVLAYVVNKLSQESCSFAIGNPIDKRFCLEEGGAWSFD